VVYSCNAKDVHLQILPSEQPTGARGLVVDNIYSVKYKLTYSMEQSPS
jgi:hypothetical protein